MDKREEQLLPATPPSVHHLVTIPVNGRLKDELGGQHILVCGPAKVLRHLRCGIVALPVDQWLRLTL